MGMIRVNMYLRIQYILEEWMVHHFVNFFPAMTCCHTLNDMKEFQYNPLVPRTLCQKYSKIHNVPKVIIKERGGG